MIKKIKGLASSLGISKCLSLFPGQLSAGQCQLSSLAKAIIKKPSLLLLDEAFSNLDPENKKQFLKTIKALQKEYSPTILFVTHNYQEIYEIADYVAIMENGKINKIIDRNDKLFNHLEEIIEN